MEKPIVQRGTRIKNAFPWLLNNNILLLCVNTKASKAWIIFSPPAFTCMCNIIEIQSLTSCSCQTASVKEQLKSWFEMNRQRSVFERSDLANICRSGLLSVLLCDESFRQKPQSKYSTQTAAHYMFVPDFVILNCRLMKFCLTVVLGCRKHEK